MFKQLLEPHNLFILVLMAVVSAGWLLGRVDTQTALPLLASLALGGGIANAYQRGVATGVPLQTPPEPAAPPSEVVHQPMGVVA